MVWCLFANYFVVFLSFTEMGKGLGMATVVCNFVKMDGDGNKMLSPCHSLVSVPSGPLSSNNLEQIIYTYGAQANSALHPSGVGK